MYANFQFCNFFYFSLVDPHFLDKFCEFALSSIDKLNSIRLEINTRFINLYLRIYQYIKYIKKHILLSWRTLLAFDSLKKKKRKEKSVWFENNERKRRDACQVQRACQGRITTHVAPWPYVHLVASTGVRTIVAHVKTQWCFLVGVGMRLLRFNGNWCFRRLRV